ncbi:MAG: hypothetical protein FD130_1406, partial [Halothiobacillaceae bacterium]
DDDIIGGGVGLIAVLGLAFLEYKTGAGLGLSAALTCHTTARTPHIIATANIAIRDYPIRIGLIADEALQPTNIRIGLVIQCIGAHAGWVGARYFAEAQPPPDKIYLCVCVVVSSGVFEIRRCG